MMKNKTLALSALLAMFIGTAACGERATPTEAGQPAAPGSIQAFEQEVERLREELNIPGLSVAVLQGQEVVFAQGFGYADVENQIPATENTPYHIASLTKPFAAAIIMQLVEAGQLGLDDEIADILGDFLFMFPDSSIHGYASLGA